jgi:hypothetical protein
MRDHPLQYRQPFRWEIIERNVALRAHAHRLCEAARLLREIAERTRSESRRLKETNARLALQLEVGAAASELLSSRAHGPRPPQSRP